MDERGAATNLPADVMAAFFDGLGRRAGGTAEFIVDAWGLGRSMGLGDAAILDLVESLVADGYITGGTLHGGDLVIRLTPRGVARYRAARKTNGVHPALPRP